MVQQVLIGWESSTKTSHPWTRDSFSAWFGNQVRFNRWKLRKQLWRPLYDKRATGGTEGLFSVDLVGVHHPQPQRFTHQTWALRQSISPTGFSLLQSVSLLWGQLFLPRKLCTADNDRWCRCRWSLSSQSQWWQSRFPVFPLSLSSALDLGDRREICQTYYTTRSSGQKFYTPKVRKLRLFWLTLKQRKCINISQLINFVLGVN